VVVIKAHHSFGDGLAFAALFLALSNENDPGLLPNLKPIPMKMKVMFAILRPFIMAYSLIVNLFKALTNKEFNPIKRGLPISGKKAGAFTLDFDLPKIKTFCKKNECTINDYMMTIVNMSVREYMVKNQTIKDTKYPIPETINFASLYSLREPFKSIKDCKMDN
jgi:NRPS condensation-like uncharacterized protein